MDLLVIQLTLHDNVNNNNLLNDEEYDPEGDNINCKNYPLINRIKNEYIKETAKNCEAIKNSIKITRNNIVWKYGP